MLTGDGTGTAANAKTPRFHGVQSYFDLGVSQIQPEPFAVKVYPFKQVDIIFAARQLSAVCPGHPAVYRPGYKKDVTVYLLA